MKIKTNFMLPTVSAIMFIALIILVKTVDVASIGADSTKIGLSHLNHAAHTFFGTNTAWYEITEILGMISIAAGGIFALLGVFQLMKRKSLIKVDSEILSLGGLYVLLGIVYIFFEKVIVNYRPVFAPGEISAEASFPSSHTVLTVVIMGSIIMVLEKYIKNKTIRQIISAICAAVAVITVIGRLLSGVHWLTDILGGLILSVFLLSLFNCVTGKITHK